MCGGLQSIQNKLVAINEAVFQELCDSFLMMKYHDYSKFSRTGSQTGKQKTVKGTPDSLTMLPNGKYILVEYSTNVTKGITKLIDDVRKCIDVKKTHIPVEDIEKIILCANFKINDQEIQDLFRELPQNGPSLKVYDLDALALELFLAHRNLVHEYLGLPMDTGQVVSVNRFIQEYNKASRGIATPLDNTFLYRKEELQDMTRKIQQNDLVILYGAPGTGKTRLALETTRHFVQDHPSFTAYCISYKHVDLIGDLSFYLKPEKDYILVVDDANRVDNFLQIIAFYSQQRTGKLKILITVRDYAFEDLKKKCVALAPDCYTIGKFTEEQIVDLVKEEPFGILNYRYQTEIVRIAGGNLRLAIMTAMLAKEKQRLSALRNVSDLFERYFQTFALDVEDFSDRINIQVLGLIAFFRKLQFQKKDQMVEMLSHFHIDYDTFVGSIERLDRLEIVEIQYGFVKLPEQNLRMFFFYKAFINDALLSFKTLFDQYFDTNTELFTDSVIPAHNSLGDRTVMGTVKPVLQEYRERIRGEKEKEVRLFSAFWFYLQDETLDFVYDWVEKLPECGESAYEVTYDENRIAFAHNEVIEMLARLFRYPDHLKDALELALEYCRRLPRHVPLLLYHIRKELTFNGRDEGIGFSRQDMLFELLTGGMKQGDRLSSKMFFELAKTFLAFRFQDFTAGFKKYSVSLRYYPLPDHERIRSIRARIWRGVEDYFSEEAFEVLRNYTHTGHEVVKEIMAYDLSFICRIIEQHLKPEIFGHCDYVHEQIRQWRHFEIEDPYMKDLSQRFTNDLYEFFLKFRWDRMRDKEEFEYDNYDEYVLLKEKKIRRYFLINQEADVEVFCDRLVGLGGLSSDFYRGNLSKSLDIVVDETFRRDRVLGGKLLQAIARREVDFQYIPDFSFQHHLVNEENSSLIWNIIQSHASEEERGIWEMAFYRHIAEDLITSEYLRAIRMSVRNLKSGSILFLGNLSKFIQKEETLLEDLLKIVLSRNEQGVEIMIWYNVLEVYLKRQDANIQVAKRVYIQQARIKEDFDYQKKAFLLILEKDPHFLVDYVDALYLEKKKKWDIDPEDGLQVVWKIDGIEPVIKELFDSISRSIICTGLSEHFCNSFFERLTGEEYEKAKRFLLDYCRENDQDTDRMNLVVDIAKNTMKELYREVLLLFVSRTQDVELFSKIYWHRSMYCCSGNVLIGNKKAEEWTKILNIIEEVPLGIKLRPIKRFVNSLIEAGRRQAETELKSRFIERE